MGAAVEGKGRCLNSAQVAMAASAIILGIRIQDLFPEPSSGNAYPVVEPRYRSEIANDQYDVICGTALTDQAEDAGLRIAAVYPFETFGLEVKLVEWWLIPVKPIEVTDALLQSRMR